MTWDQTYLLFGQGIGVSAALAALPVLTLLLLLGIFRRPAWAAGLAGLAVTLALACGGYRMPVRPALSAAAYGAAFGLFPITWIIFWALALFRVTSQAGKFEIIKNSIGRLTPDPRLQALLIAFTFGAFLEGAAGFGTPVAIAATMLVGLGFSPWSAAAAGLLANTAPVAFGSIGIPIFTLAGTTGLSVARLSAAVGAIDTPFAMLLPLYLMLALGGAAAMSGIWAPVLLTGLVFGLVQWSISTFLGPQLTDILSSIAAMAALVVLLRHWQARPILGPGATTSPLLERFTHRHAGSAPALPLQARPQPASASIAQHPPTRAVLTAWLPYGLLVACVLLWGWTPVQRAMSTVTLALRWPFLHDAVRRMPPIVPVPAPYHAVLTLNWLSAAGTACMLATLLSAACLGIGPRQFGGILRSIAWELRLPTITVSAVLAIAFLMNYCGATATLGLGFASTGRLFPFFSPLLGWVGVFLTGSDTSSNALFGNLQVVTANRLGFSPVLMAAANSAGGVMGKMISLQTIAIAAAATGLGAADQARLFRFTLRHSLLLAGLTGALTLGYAYVLHLG